MRSSLLKKLLIKNIKKREKFKKKNTKKLNTNFEDLSL